jgi:hypothetical protein
MHTELDNNQIAYITKEVLDFLANTKIWFFL